MLEQHCFKILIFFIFPFSITYCKCFTPEKSPIFAHNIQTHYMYIVITKKGIIQAECSKFYLPLRVNDS